MSISKIRYHAGEIIQLSYNLPGTGNKQCPHYRIPDLSKLSSSINRELVKALWNNYHKSTTWKSWADIYNHGTKVFHFSHDQMDEIGVALGFLEDDLEDDDEPEPSIKKKKLCGASARQILRSHVGLAKPINGGNFLPVYEKRIIESGVNYVREDILDVTRWGSTVAKHTEKFIEAGITIEYTLADGDKQGYGDYKEAIQFLKPYAKHVICEVENEFGDDFSKVRRAFVRGKFIDNAGLISSGGAYGNLLHGKEHSEIFLLNYLPQIITMHRPYPPIEEFRKWITFLKGFNRPIIENEFLIDDPYRIELYAGVGFDMGLYGFNVYGGDEGTEFLPLMGKLCRGLNG